MRLPRAHAADEHDVGGLGDEAAVEDLQNGIAVEVRLRLEREGVQRLQHREAGILDAALDAALPAAGDLQMRQLRRRPVPDAGGRPARPGAATATRPSTGTASSGPRPDAAARRVSRSMPSPSTTNHPMLHWTIATSGLLQHCYIATIGLLQHCYIATIGLFGRLQHCNHWTKDSDGNYLATCQAQEPVEDGLHLGAVGKFISITVLNVAEKLAVERGGRASGSRRGFRPAGGGRCEPPRGDSITGPPRLSRGSRPAGRLGADPPSACSRSDSARRPAPLAGAELTLPRREKYTLSDPPVAGRRQAVCGRNARAAAAGRGLGGRSGLTCS